MQNNHQITYTEKGFTLIKPKIGRSTFYAWNSIDTLVLKPYVIPRPGTYWKRRYIVFLNTPPETQPDANASWINRTVFKLFRSANNTTLNLYDIMPDFESFLP